MEDTIEKAVGRAIVAMQENLGEELTVDDMARAALFSKFHFTRVFQRVTGVSPGRFLSALRIQRAKELLVSTSVNVADISMQVGYNSVGTFSSRFSRSVGMPPTTYRRLNGFTTLVPSEPNAHPNQQATAQVGGQIWSDDDNRLGGVFVGLFPSRIPEGPPARCAMLDWPGSYRFDLVPPGDWYLLAQSVVAGQPDCDQTVYVGANGPHRIREDTVLRAGLELKPARALDPPMLLALLDARNLARATAAAHRIERPAA